MTGFLYVENIGLECLTHTIRKSRFFKLVTVSMVALMTSLDVLTENPFCEKTVVTLYFKMSVPGNAGLFFDC